MKFNGKLQGVVCELNKDKQARLYLTITTLRLYLTITTHWAEYGSHIESSSDSRVLQRQGYRSCYAANP